ncbi:class I SAM-dependent methyltransferase [Pontibacter sp. BT310]|jgi:2-polyprenyl-3-methyl-5-hydroxy-6-metoxy-1,4-benzoquinol methylase|uniref:Class I SAM-dependent methyltransferase n=1 Tax=Pontibacter populi TaxID=890055 RepID=A0ABS6X9Z9_9BACT|nr:MULTISPECIES: class I SAM-dependent methyltransferase [Pontibacter]MBJ6117627.1 class I SAM-dependent methyltransferase [Pontibacter sp. BT310]MBR0570052.1 class I SAM-dependent methyltransferase [Microvirga sp. STS03]MBW3364479.1 class I SAM-dependent methyltransferase [Pontibacter populi]
MSYERLEQCPICGKEEFKNFLVVTDNSVSKESFVIVECENCTFKFTNPRPDIESIGSYYESEEYISHSNTKTGIINRAYHVVRSITTKQKVELINRYAPAKGSILDYGCGTGVFLTACKKDGWKVQGVEPNDKARELAAESAGTTIATDLGEVANEKFNVITLWHVLEHIHTLNETISQLISHLTEDGVLIVAVPNADSHDAKQYKENWAAYDVPRHLYHFTQPTMKRFLKRHKMQLEEVLPMKFDAYYVSMLSEKHKEGKTKMISSVLNGYKSNSYAEKNGNDYSSLIFVAKRK